MAKIPRAPRTLEKDGRLFWRRVLKDFALSDEHHLRMLEQACTCLDRITEARAEIETHGAYYRDRFGQPKEHPGHRTERDNKTLFARLVRELALDLEPPADSRPKRQYH